MRAAASGYVFIHSPQTRIKEEKQPRCSTGRLIKKEVYVKNFIFVIALTAGMAACTHKIFIIQPAAQSSPQVPPILPLSIFPGEQLVEVKRGETRLFLYLLGPDQQPKNNVGVTTVHLHYKRGGRMIDVGRLI